MTLWADFLNNQQRIIHKWTHYFPIYEKHFKNWVYQPLVFLEIGVSNGGSLQMWKRYFGPLAQIVGIDIKPKCRDYEEDQIAIRIGSQSDTGFLAGVIEEFGAPDIVLDDGSHAMQDLAASFEFLYPRISPRGVYMAEDLHTCYWQEYGGGLQREGTFIELTKTLIDRLNADHTRGALPPDDFSRETFSIHIYDSIIAFEKGRHVRKHCPMTGRRTAELSAER
jgi:hypothetical protein